MGAISKKIRIFRAASIFSGTIIGAGILGLPYVSLQAGFFNAMISFILVAILMILTSLMLGELTLRSKKIHQIPGIIKAYFGRKGEIIVFITMVSAGYGAILAYLIGIPSALNQIFPDIGTQTFAIATVLFVGFIVLTNIRVIDKIESLIISLIILLTLTLFFISLKQGDYGFLVMQPLNLKNIFVPYGVFVFAFMGLVSIPEVREDLMDEPSLVKYALLLGFLIPTILYFLFIVSVLSISQHLTTPIATIGLGQVLGRAMIIFGNVLAVFAMLTSYLAVTFALEQIFIFDFNFKKGQAWMLAVIVPFLLYVLVSGKALFTDVMGITGAIADGIMVLMIILAFYKAKGKGTRNPEYELNIPKFVGALMLAMLALGILSVLF